MNKLIVGLSLAAFSSAAYALWSIFSDIVVSLNPISYLDYLVIFEASLFLINILLILLFKEYRKIGRRKPKKSLFFYSLLSGIFFGLGSIIFYSLIGNQNYPFVASASYITIIPFIFILASAKKQDPKTLAIIGTVIVFAGLVLQVVALYGSNFGAATRIIFLTALMSVSWMLGSYFLLISMVYKGYNIIKADALTAFFEFITVGVFGLSIGAFNGFFKITPLELALSVAVAGFLVLGGLSEEFSLHILKRFKQKILDLWNVLVDLEIVGIALFSIFFLTLYYPFLIIGLALTILGSILIALS